MIIYCGRPTSAPFNDRFSDIVRAMRRETIVEICSMWDALVTMIITRTGSWALAFSNASPAVKKRQATICDAGCGVPDRLIV